MKSHVLRRTLLLILCTFTFLLSFSQEKTITGVISDQSGNPLSGATVSVKGTKTAVTSATNGTFKISVPSDVNALIISYVGMKSQEISIKGKATIAVSLNEVDNSLNEVVVIGYGKTKKSDLSSAVGTVSSADLNKTVNVTLDEALQGKAANLYVSQTSGQPGAAASVIIRGVSTVTGNYQPLYVIDGVQIRPSTPTGGTYNLPTGFANQLAGINPDDIDNISVLQGPAATSIYGAAGANGVLMITTKHGKSGQTKVTASSLLTIQDRPEKLPVMNLQQYALYLQKFQSLGLYVSISPELVDPSILGPGTDWQNALFRRTNLYKHSLAISGGTDKATFYFSSDYLKQDGVALGSGFDRASVRLNLDNQAN
jgi:TonB-dependent SusC/RagA subfamily outer membrane receptor